MQDCSWISELMQGSCWLNSHVAQDLPGWTLLGEYTGVWDSQDKGTQRTNDDAMGLGTMRRDKVTALGYTSGEASEDVQKGAPPSCTPFPGG